MEDRISVEVGRDVNGRLDYIFAAIYDGYCFMIILLHLGKGQEVFFRYFRSACGLSLTSFAIRNSQYYHQTISTSSNRSPSPVLFIE